MNYANNITTYNLLHCMFCIYSPSLFSLYIVIVVVNHGAIIGLRTQPQRSGID